MVINITNPSNGYKASFYQMPDWNESYRGCDTVTPAIEDNAYLILRGEGLVGLFELPFNNSISNGGLDRDGERFLSNYYSNRVITFTFKQVLDSNLIKLANTFYQNDHRLDIHIQHHGRDFYTTGTLEGTYNGVIDLSCDPWFSTGYIKSEDHIYKFSNGTKALIPFKVNSVYFEDEPKSNIFTITSNFMVEPIITITGDIHNLRLINKTTNSSFRLDGSYQEIVIDSPSNDVYADDVNKINDYKGLLPLLHAGDNMFEIITDDFNSDIKINISYDEIVGSVF